jgi:ATP diphosphatase
MTPSKDISRLIEIMAALRDPDGGCPWDLKQTFATIAPYTIEEAYEVADAIARGDLDELKDELGDLLLQVVYHARMAEERGTFAFADVVEAITTKMIRRHPHVFGTADERAAGAAPGFWDRAKAAEKAASADAGLLDDVPVALPALARAIKLQNKAAKVGFDWPSLTPVLSKLKEELAELEEAIASNPKEGTDRHAIEEEFGDFLFVVANVARHLKIDPEGALRAANEKFIRRFRYIEARLGEHGRSPAQSTLAEMDALWDAAKTKGL